MYVAPLLATLGWLAAASGAGDAQVRTPRDYAAFVLPQVGGSYTDTSFGVSIKRLSDARRTPNTWLSGLLNFVSTEYPGASPFNSDNSLLILQHQGYYGLYTGSGDYLKDLPFVLHAATEPRWSRSEPDVLYYVSVNRLMKLSVAAGTSTLVRAFSEYNAIRGRGESDISADGDHFVFAADDLPSGPTPGLVNRSVFVYQISTNTKGPVLDTTGHPFNSLYLAPDNSVALGWSATGSARFTGVELFNKNMVFQRQLTHALGHMHLTKEMSGDDVLVWTNSNDPSPLANCENGIVKVRLKDAVQTCLLELDWSLAVHITAPDRNGWVFVETYDPTDPLPGTPGWKLYTNEILQVKLDGAEVRRLFHHRSRRTASYALQPRASVSRDGSRLVFSSNYGLGSAPGYPGDYTDAYLVSVPLTPPPRVSISEAIRVEGDCGVSGQLLTVTLSPPSALRVSVKYQTVDATAVAPSDYGSLAVTTLTFEPGETTKDIAVTVNGDLDGEGDEVFFVDLTEPVNASLEGLGQVTIINDDLRPTDVIGVTPTLIGAAIPRLVNISTRGLAATGDNIMVGGFIIGGALPKRVVIRGRGPSMAALGVPGTLRDPTIRLFSGSTPIAFNDDWQSTDAVSITASGFAPTDPKEAAILTTVNPCVPYTVHLSGVGETSGIAIVEVFELGQPEVPLTNISTRGLVATGDNVLIGGFIIQGGAAQRVLVIARGPGLSALGVAGAMEDPVLELYQAGNPIPITANDNWVDSADAPAIGVDKNRPTHTLESAILRTLPPGAYTAIVRGRIAGGGIGIVEVFRR